MVKELPQTKQDTIQAHLKEGRAHIHIIEEMNVSIQTVKNFSTNLKHHGVVKLPIISQRGRPPTLTQAMVDVLISNPQSRFTFFACANHDSRH